MSNEHSLFPSLNKRRIETIGYDRMNITFTYDKPTEKNIRVSINDSIKDPLIVLNDINSNWDSEIDNLNVEFDLDFKNLKFLFEKDGIVGKMTEIGIAVQWHSRVSRQRGVEILDTIDYSKSLNVFVSKKIHFPAKTLRGSIYFDIFLFIKESDPTPKKSEEYKMNIKGANLGLIDTFQVLIDGEGTDFPLSDYTDIKGPLWKIMCTWNNPLEESFNDTVSILLNRGNKSYKYVSSDNKKDFNPTLMNEIMFNALEIIINKVKNSDFWSQVEELESEEGTVGAAVMYFIQTFELDTSSEEGLAYSLRMNINFE